MTRDETQEAAEDEPLRLAGVEVPDEAARQLHTAWKRIRGSSLYDTPSQFMQLVEQVSQPASRGQRLLTFKAFGSTLARVVHQLSLRLCHL
jgi:hypothetical protein